MQGVLDSIDGNPSTVDCAPGGECAFDIDNFFVKLVAPCTNAECLVPGYVMAEGEGAARVLHNSRIACMEE